jgi:hypothetical protein
MSFCLHLSGFVGVFFAFDLLLPDFGVSEELESLGVKY